MEMPTKPAPNSGCEPKKCGRYVIDKLVSSEEADQLIAIAEKGMVLSGGGAGGVSSIIIFLSYSKGK